MTKEQCSTIGITTNYGINPDTDEVRNLLKDKRIRVMGDNIRGWNKEDSW